MKPDRVVDVIGTCVTMIGLGFIAYVMFVVEPRKEERRQAAFVKAATDGCVRESFGFGGWVYRCPEGLVTESEIAAGKRP